ncbi:MAG: hypothetical protein V3T83_15700 [Acidobacteriota bacterium]
MSHAKVRKSLNRPFRALYWAWLFLAAAPLLGGSGAESASSSHPLGRFDPQEAGARIVIRNLECRIDQPVVAGEKVVLTTVGSQHTVNGRPEFHPLMSVLVDRTFSETPDGHWLAVWNLGHKKPGFFSRLRALIPGFTARKRSPKGELKGLENRLRDFNRLHSEGRFDLPKPAYNITQGFRRSTMGLILSGIKQGLSWADVTFLGQFFYRGYLLRLSDLHHREFQHTYLGLTWYQDLAYVTPQPEPLSAQHIQDIKFRMLANRHILGRWVKPEAAQDFIHGYENELRDHLWGTSCFLASAANEYRLGYEELQRYTASGVPLALGGILYYEPEKAPAPEMARWPTANPFDLTYNPFTDSEVQEAAASGRKVPLALYVYQSNLALKPIIAVDFFRPNNPRLRESGTYWRKLGNEALGSASRVGFLYSILNRAFSFSVNRKEVTWLSDIKLALGIDELRYSLQGHLYFEPESADRLLDQVDRMIVNPLVQPGRVQRLRAQLHHQILEADEGKGLVVLARRLREKRIRKATRLNGPMSETAYTEYRRLLRIEEDLNQLELYLNEPFALSIPSDQVARSIRSLAAEAGERDPEAVEALLRFRWEGSKRRGLRRQSDPEAQQLVELSEKALLQIYQTMGRGEEELQADFAAAQEREAARLEQAKIREQKNLAKHFRKQMLASMKTLQALAGTGGDLSKVSPWHVNRAVQFFEQAPAVMAGNPIAAKKYRKKEKKIRLILDQAEQALADSKPSRQIAWIEEQRAFCLASLRGLQEDLRAAQTTSPQASKDAPLPAEAPNQSGGSH